MIKNYLLIAWRVLQRNKVFAAINILGLALGMACSLLIFLWIHDENTIDHFNINPKELFSVYERQYYDNKIETDHSTPGVLADEIKRVMPEVEYASGYAFPEVSTFQVGDKIIKKTGNYAGKDFFKMFNYRLVQGNANYVLATPSDIAISTNMATDIYGSPEAAMGKTIRYQNKKDFKVTAVYENIKNSSEKFDFLVNWYSFLEGNSWAKDWENNGPRTYILLHKGTDPIAFEKKIVHFLDNYNKNQGKGYHIELGIQRFDEMYLHNHFSPTGQLEGGRIEYVHLFEIIAIFILLIACINFMNLTTARSVNRSREVGVRKVVGAKRSALIIQFIGEAILFCGLAVVIALALVSILLPFFNTLSGKQIQLPISNTQFWINTGALTMITGFIAGSYPALYLSSFRPIKVLKGTLKFTARASLFRKGLVVFQFVLSVILIIGTIVISRQIQYIRTKNLGYNRENLLYLPLDGDITKKYPFFKQQALNLRGIKYITRITQTPTQIDMGTAGVEWEGKDPTSKPMFTPAFVGYDFIKTMGITLLMGRDFSKDFPTDSVGYILNEQALKKIGYKDPIGKPLTFWGQKGTIIGVIKDFHFNSLKLPVAPLILRLGENENYGNALIRIESGQTKPAMANLQQLWKQINPQFPFTYKFSDEEFNKLYETELTVGKLSDCFAFLAIFISCLGLLGLTIFTVEQRSREISIRKVLGASINGIFRLLSWDFLTLVLLALLIAIPLGNYIMHIWLQTYYYRTNMSWWIFVLVSVITIAIALFTISFQSIKAAITKPIKNLRTE